MTRMGTDIKANTSNNTASRLIRAHLCHLCLYSGSSPCDSVISVVKKRQGPDDASFAGTSRLGEFA
jgi:hypothetical protein